MSKEDIDNYASVVQYTDMNTTQELRYVPTEAESRLRVSWDVPTARRPEAPRFCDRCGDPAPHEWVQWYTEAGRRMFRVMSRCDGHAPRIQIIDHDLEGLTSPTLEREGRIVLIQSPTDPGDIGEPREWNTDGVTYLVVPHFDLWRKAS